MGKSTLCNLLTGAKYVLKEGSLGGYEDQMFPMSADPESKTTGVNAKMLPRGWCGSLPVFEVMDTPGAVYLYSTGYL